MRKMIGSEKNVKAGIIYPCIISVLSVLFQTLLLLEGEGMAKEDLLFTLKKLLQTDAYREFLLQLDEADLRTLIACIRERIDRGK